MIPKLCIRKSDGAVFEPSTPDGYTAADAIRDTLTDGGGFYFRRLEWVPAPWWKFWTDGRWVRTGEVWEPESGEFRVVYRRDHRPEGGG